MKIQNQKIYGGNQQFADSIINNNSGINFSQQDRDLLKFVEAYASEKEKIELGESIIKINSETASQTEKDSYTKKIQDFLKTHQKDIIKWAGIIGRTGLTLILAKFGLDVADFGLDKE